MNIERHHGKNGWQFTRHPEKWKKKLRDRGVRVPLGGAIREMDNLLKDNDLGFSKTDLKGITHALAKLKEILEKYDKPSFSGVIVKMDSMIKED